MSDRCPWAACYNYHVLEKWIYLIQTVLRRLIWVYTVWQCPFYVTLGMNGLKERMWSYLAQIHFFKWSLQYRKVSCSMEAPSSLLFFHFSKRWQFLIGPEVIKHFSCSTQLSMKFSLLINLKLQTIANSFLLNIAEHANFAANKSENAS